MKVQIHPQTGVVGRSRRSQMRMFEPLLTLKLCFALFHEGARTFLCIGCVTCDPLPLCFGEQLFGV